MSTVFVSLDIWRELTKAVHASRQRCSVAVAYFGKGASRLLPLCEGSRLVVDASERSVASGQTCPADLIRLVNRGVTVYSVSNLHAKVFVLGRAAYVGSANVSSRSSLHLIEAVVRSTEPHIVGAARQFVQEHCLYELTPTILKRLDKLYRPPLVPGGKRGERQKRPMLPRLFLTQLHPVDFSARDEASRAAGLEVAKKRREHPRNFELEDFRYTGKCAYERGDMVIQITRERDDRELVSPQGNVLHVRTRREGNRKVSFVYLERPARRRRSIQSLARGLGRGALKQLRRNAMIRDAAFAQSLLRAWAN